MTTSADEAAGREVLDPVCGMTIDPAEAAGHAEYKGQTYYFCHQSCLDRFRAAPEDFLQPHSATGGNACGTRGRRVHLPDGPRGAADRVPAPAPSAGWRSSL